MLVQRSPAQMKPAHPGNRAFLNGFPHHQVIGAQMLKRIIRRPELVDSLISVVQKNRGCNRLFTTKRGRDEAMSIGEHKPGDVFEEPNGLAGNSMTTPGLAVELIKRPHRLHAPGELNLQPCSLCLAHSPTHRARKPLKQYLGISSQ